MIRKILFYNWIPFDEKEGKGGGVTIYTRNLIESFANLSNWEVFFLSSGRAYDLFRNKAYIRNTSNALGEKCHSFEIVNSPVFSSARISFPYPERIINDEMLLNVMSGFCSSVGGFDVIHYQNFEGLSLSVFKLKERFPQTHFVYSLHNYYLFCPQVMLWRNDVENCALEKCGEECFGCMPKDVFDFKVKINQYVDWKCYKRNGSIRSMFLMWMKKYASKKADRLLKKNRFNNDKVKELGKCFSEIEKSNIFYLNKYFDSILAVSERVKEIAVRKGVDASKVMVNYIGTAVAESQEKSQRVSFNGNTLNICFLGHMRTMKGFYFLLNALENMPENMSTKIGLVIATPFTDASAIEKLNRIGKHFASLTLYDGYSHDELDKILKDVHLGIVPPLWEDNLPQVAIEMKAKGVAVLSSDLGGAHELSRAREFIFRAGDKQDFYDKIRYILDNPQIINRYWEKQMKLITMEEHLKQLEQIYSATIINGSKND